MSVGIVIRTYNEERHLDDLLVGIENQQTSGINVEVTLVDSGSTDDTLDIAKKHDCQIIRIKKEQFSFGRSLNAGCQASKNDYLVFVSGHCVPVKEDWIVNLISPLQEKKTQYAYGRQLGNGQSRFSECQLFKKYYPDMTQIPQDGYFVNNANAAIPRTIWEKYGFDEELSGLEDMAFGKQLVRDGGQIAYVADAAVYHLHDESWRQVRWRFEREAIALQSIMPEVHFGVGDVVRYFVSAVLVDSGIAVRERRLLSTLPEIAMFRMMQFWGTYRGNHEHRKLSKVMKEKYFYPK